jgi:hypothetical protein
MNRVTADLSSALSGIPLSPPAASRSAPEPASATGRGPAPSARTSTEQHQVKPVSPPPPTRVALVIGNSNYSSLSRLSNAANDARSVSELLRKMGFTTRLVVDVSEQALRREVRSFASESEKADIALIFYGGHGAQVNGDNYVLPVDMDVPRTETDIQLTGLKVDDLVNSIRSNIKVIFLDACRDNPALFKNIVKGRGSYAAGLAPANASHLDSGKPGGGVFIAYATDSRAVALDGSGQHSPFAQALLRNLAKPISIDDLFSLVTKEVRLVTNNAQRPYKYASLESIVCLTGACGAPVPPTLAGIPDIVQQTQLSEAEEFQIAIATNEIPAIETYLAKYPDSNKRNELFNRISTIARSEHTEWTLFEVSNLRFPHYVRLSSVEPFNDRVAVQWRWVVDPSSALIGDKKFDDATYSEDVTVVDCTSPQLVLSERTLLNQANDTISHYKWADPHLLDFSIGTKFIPGTVPITAQNILCHDVLRTPLLHKSDLLSMKFRSLASTINGDGDIYYIPPNGDPNKGQHNKLNVVAIVRFHEDHVISDALAPGTTIADTSRYRFMAELVEMHCTENKLALEKLEYYDPAGNLIYLTGSDLSKPIPLSEFGPVSPIGMLQRAVCDLGVVHR